MKTQTTVRVSSPAPKKPARKDSAACVSLSSYHNVKEPFEPEALPQTRTPDGSKSPIRSQRQPQSPETSSGLIRSCPKDRAAAYSPAGSRDDPREGVI